MSICTSNGLLHCICQKDVMFTHLYGIYILIRPNVKWFKRYVNFSSNMSMHTQILCQFFFILFVLSRTSYSLASKCLNKILKFLPVFCLFKTSHNFIKPFVTVSECWHRVCVIIFIFVRIGQTIEVKVYLIETSNMCSLWTDILHYLYCLENIAKCLKRQQSGIFLSK